jgi:mono/diheme cytochrome c family protein
MTKRAIVFGVIGAVTMLGVSLHAGGQYAARPKAADVPTFNRDIAPILYANCTTCHRPGEIAPMSLLSYEDARPWAKAMRDEVGAGVMPPWHADPKVGHFKNERRLTDEQRDLIVRWANGGAPRGNPNDLPPAPKYTDGWTIGEPDLVLAMPVEYRVPADGFVEYEYIEIPTNLTEDRWVQAFEVRPGNREVVHHVIAYARPPAPERRPAAFRAAEGMAVPAGQTGGPKEPEGQKRARGVSLYPAPRTLGASIGGFAPGTSASVYEPDTAILLRAGSTIVLQMHYTSTGEVQVDRTRVGMKFAAAPPTEELRITALANGSLRIPPGASDYSIAAEMTATQDVTLRQILPHTHLRGKKWEYSVIHPDGRTEVILSVPKYDFNWQTSYIFATPLKLAKGSKIRAIAHYDNSPANRSNPDPKAEVTWGDQTWEEMMFSSIVFSIDGVRPGTVITASGGQ